jgi:hypothetical protein
MEYLLGGGEPLLRLFEPLFAVYLLFTCFTGAKVQTITY